MVDYVQGVRPTQVDTIALWPLGLEAKDPRVKTFPANIIRYVRASAAGVTLGVAVRLDVAATDEPGAVIPTTNTQTGGVIHGVAHVAIPNGSYGWITTHGAVPNAVVPDAAVAGTNLGGGAAGAMIDISGTPTAALATAAASGRGVTLLQDTGTALGTVWIE
jgi:hypothetical protein